ncbi:MAG: hypothetical protein KAU20_00145 [Nanoarchaeota archaeon]|nr:hypothetical protein [Nanoarchaeota archaeon]
MNDNQFNEICKRLDKIFAITAIQGINNKDDKIFALRQLGFGYKEIGPLVGMKDIRKTVGWNRK